MSPLTVQKPWWLLRVEYIMGPNKRATWWDHSRVDWEVNACYLRIGLKLALNHDALLIMRWHGSVLLIRSWDSKGLPLRRSHNMLEQNTALAVDETLHVALSIWIWYQSTFAISIMSLFASVIINNSCWCSFSLVQFMQRGEHVRNADRKPAFHRGTLQHQSFAPKNAKWRNEQHSRTSVLLWEPLLLQAIMRR